MTMQDHAVTVQPMSASLSDPSGIKTLTDLVIEAARDDVIWELTNFILFGLDGSSREDAALGWLSTALEDLSFTISVDGVLAGCLHYAPKPLSTGGFPIPTATAETEVWLLEKFRGQGFISIAKELATPTVAAAGFSHTLAAICEYNEPSLRLARRNPKTEFLGWAPWFQPSKDLEKVRSNFTMELYGYFLTPLT